jgi:hypothetical protein
MAAKLRYIKCGGSQTLDFVGESDDLVGAFSAVRKLREDFSFKLSSLGVNPTMRELCYFQVDVYSLKPQYRGDKSMITGAILRRGESLGNYSESRHHYTIRHRAFSVVELNEEQSRILNSHPGGIVC